MVLAIYGKATLVLSAISKFHFFSVYIIHTDKKPLEYRDC